MSDTAGTEPLAIPRRPGGVPARLRRLLFAAVAFLLVAVVLAICAVELLWGFWACLGLTGIVGLSGWALVGLWDQAEDEWEAWTLKVAQEDRDARRCGITVLEHMGEIIPIRGPGPRDAA